MLYECYISFFVPSFLYFSLTLSISGRYSDLWVSANLHISFYPPYLQLETHGCDEGIGFNNGEILKWKDFYDIIRPLNIKTGHLLFIVMAMCKSVAMISSINPEKRAPYRAFICTTRKVTSDEIYRGFLAFYDKYFNLLDVSHALTALQNEVKDDNEYSPFQALSAESVFDETFNPNRNISSLVDNQLEQLNIPITDSTRSIMAYHIQQ